MPNKHLAHKFMLSSLAAVTAVVLVGVTTLGGSHAQVPPTPFIPGQPNPAAATATYVAIISMAGQPQQAQQLQQQQLLQQQQQLLQQQQQLQQQVPGVPGAQNPQAGVAATATYAAVLANLNRQVPTGSTTPSPAAQAPITSPTPAPAQSGATTAVDACTLPLQSASGGQTIEFEQVQLTLPAGNYLYGFVRPDGGAQPALVVCSSQTSSTIYLDARTGQETARRANGEAGTTALNQIRAAAHTLSGSAGGGGASGGITPPNTGDGGLR